MSRSGYNEDYDDEWALIRWRGAVEASIKGRRGQQLLRELLAALDAMPVKRLISGYLEAGSEVCALGCLGRARNLDMSRLDPEDSPTVGRVFGIAPALAQEIVFMNDEWRTQQTPEERWAMMRQWVAKNIRHEEVAT